MSTEQMRKLMEAAAPLDEQEVEEDFVTEPMQAYTTIEPEDPFHDENPAQPLTVVARVDVPAMYMNAGDELYLQPTNNHGEAYSEENGLTYDWDFIFHLVRDKDMLEIKQVGDDEPMEPFVEDEGDGENFQNKLKNPQWDERRAGEIERRSAYLHRLSRTGGEDDLRYSRVNTPRGKGTIMSIHNLEPSEAHPEAPTVAVRLDNDPGGYGGGTKQYNMWLSDVTLLEGIAGDAMRDVKRKMTGFLPEKEGIIRYAGIKAENAIRLAQLGIELEGENAEKIFGEIRKELIELKKYLRGKKKQ